MIAELSVVGFSVAISANRSWPSDLWSLIQKWWGPTGAWGNERSWPQRLSSGARESPPEPGRFHEQGSCNDVP